MQVTLTKIAITTDATNTGEGEKIAAPPKRSLVETLLCRDKSSVRAELVQSKDEPSHYFLVETHPEDATISNSNSNQQRGQEPPSSSSKIIPQDEWKGATVTSQTHWQVLFPSTNPQEDSTKPSHNFDAPIPVHALYFLVFFTIKPDSIQAFIDLLLEEAALVHQHESKCLRFDVCQSLDDDDPSKFVVLEVVEDWAAIDEHHAMPCYQKVRDALGDLQAKPRSHDQGYQVIYNDLHLS